MMNNNDILRRIRFALNLTDQRLSSIFAHVDQVVGPAEIRQFLKKEHEPGYLLLSDHLLVSFLDGLIIEKRGRQEGVSRQPTPTRELTNNDVLIKLRIALTLRSDEVIAILALVNFYLSKTELSALFRKHGHRNYKPCGSQILRNFLNGLVKKNRLSGG